MRSWLMAEGLIQAHQAKPDRPKESFERVLKRTNKRWSGSLFSKVRTKSRTSIVRSLAQTILGTIEV